MILRRMSVREEKRNKLNLAKAFIALLLIVLIVLVVFNCFFKNNKYKDSAIVTNIDEIKVDEKKTIEEIISEFGGEITEKVKDDTCYISKDGVEYTAYLDGEIVNGKVPIWDGTSLEPAVDEAGNYNIYKPEELKWIADKIISGEKNFAGVTITIRNNLDLGARSGENDEWTGNVWTSMIGFLDEINTNNQEETNNSEANINNELVTNNLEQENLDSNTQVTTENLKRFAGIFNGNNCWIRGLYINSEKRYQGLFGYQTGTIQNLTIKNSKIQGGEGTGGIVGLNGGTIVNCHTENVVINSYKQNKVGGISGINMTGSWIENCTVQNGSIYGENNVGGITGYMNNNSAIISSSNLSSISGANYVGGIAGITFYGTQIKNCYNLGKHIIGQNYVGGLVGYSESDIENSYNQNFENHEGEIIGNSYVGGLVGLNYLMGNINKSFNFGVINSESNDNVSNFGGICGLNNATISNCYNVGKIIIGDNTSVEKIGGICGQNLSDSFIYTSYNIGIIESKNAGGIVGANFGEVSKTFYLNSCIKNPVDIEFAKDESVMKSEIITELGDEYKTDDKNINNGYPILSWQ